LDGFLNLLKPPELSSQDAVAVVRRLSGRRAGHGGTLDPDAAGVLPVAVGQALPLLGRVDWSPKTYWARVRLGAATDTLDAAGTVVARSRPPWPGRDDLERAARFLTGPGVQIPPAVSSVKMGGDRAYRRVRRREMVLLPPRPVDVRGLRITASAGPDVELVAEVSSGTYVRALARDLAGQTGHAAHLVALIRTAAGPFRIEEAVTLEELEADGMEPHLLSWTTVWRGPRAALTEEEATLVATGRWPDGLRIADGVPTALTQSDRLLALAEATGRFLRVFPGGLG